MRRILLLTLLLASLSFGQFALATPIPATFFGMHVNSGQIAWPSVGFGSYRLWDDGTAWANINTANGVYYWAPLDSWVAKAQQHNVQLLYTFGRTPAWASSAPTTSCNYGSGQCVAPSNYAYWDNYVTAIATRYKGKIKYYEMWNEPNDTGFWKGTTAQMIEMTQRGAAIIHAIDPDAQVVSPGATWSSTTAWAWLDSFLTGGGGSAIDAIGFHGYTGNNKAESIFTIIDNVQKVTTAHGLALPFLITEGGWGQNTYVTDPAAQAAFLVQRNLLTLSRPNVKSFFWYQWDSPTWGTLWDSTTGTHPAGVAYAQLTSWLTGATLNSCTKDANSTWTCSFALANGNSALAVFNATASVAYVPGAQYTQVRNIDGTSATINGSTSYTVGNAPVLFVAPNAAPTTATLAITPATGIVPVTVNATVNSTVAPGVTVKSTSISFDDGTVTNASSASHTYATAGTYTLTATVTDSLNRTTTSSAVVTAAANQPPQAVLSVSPASGKAPLTVTASTTGSQDPDGSIASTTINFGDGTIVTAASATHTYTNVGNYTLTATVKDNLGATGTANVSASALANQPPVARMTLTQTAPVGYKVSAATSTDPDGTIASTIINWGDGTTTAANAGSHTYAKAGNYTVTVTVTDDNGASASTSATAAVNWGIFVVSPTSGATFASPVHFTAQAASQYGITATAILVDGKSAYAGTSWMIDTYLTLAKGSHSIVIKATDKAGVVYQAPLTITVQ